jgi:2-amino-4-hydroxy-6-hydroxymethyldihydropteridine diphosphokinase
MSTAYLGIGSNIEPRRNIPSGITALRETFAGLRLSPLYLAAAVGFDGADFINLVACVETELQPLGLKRFLQDLEIRHGRDRSLPGCSDRTLDIDILLYDDLYLLSPQLQIPRYEILTAAHVLKPLADLAPELLHPACRRTIAELWRAFPGRDTRLELVEL